MTVQSVLLTKKKVSLVVLAPLVILKYPIFPPSPPASFSLCSPATGVLTLLYFVSGDLRGRRGPQLRLMTDQIH